MQGIWRGLRLVILLALVAGPASAQQLQGAPVWPGVTLPTFVIPASAVNGGGTVTSAQLLAPDGSASAPSYSFAAATGTGWYRTASARLAGSVGGTAQAVIDTSTGFIATRSDGFLGFLSGTDLSANGIDTEVAREAADHWIHRRGTTAQRWSVANTWASTISNEVFSVDWQTTANSAITGTRTAATGTGRPLWLVSQGSSGGNSYARVALDRTNFPFFDFAITNAAGTLDSTGSAGTWWSMRGNTTATSGQTYMVAITPTYNQASGAGANTDLLIQRTETAIGSGAQYAIQTQRGSTNQFTVTAGSSTKGTQLSTAQAAVPTITTNPGTGGACVGADTFMTCTEGTSPAAAATFTVTFNGTWAAAPSCIAIRGTAGLTPLVQNVVTTTTTVQVNLSANLVASEKFHIHCGGVQ